MYAENVSEKHTLAPGSALLLVLPPGGEIFCLRGTVTILPAAQMQGDGLPFATRTLPVGQAWRSEAHQWLSVRNDEARSSAALQVCAPMVSTAQDFQAPKQNRLAPLAARRFAETLQSIRRALSGASMKTP